MESPATGIRLRKSALKPIQSSNRSVEDNEYTIASGEEQPLSPSARLFHEPNFNVYIIAILGSKKRIDPRVVFENLPHTLLKHPRFSSLQVADDKNAGTMKWVPTNVNLQNHIIIPTIPETLASPNKFLEDYVYNLSKTSIDKSKPMWELHLINLKTSDSEAAGIFRIHHSIGDGTSLMSLLLACMRQISNPDAVPTIPGNKNSNSGWLSAYSFGGGGELVWWQRWFMVVCMVCMLVWNTLVDVWYFMVTVLFLKDTETSIKAHEGAEFNPRRFVYRTVSLDDMKLIKNAMNLVSDFYIIFL